MCFGQSDEVDLMRSDEGEDGLPFDGGKTINVEEEGVDADVQQWLQQSGHVVH